MSRSTKILLTNEIPRRVLQLIILANRVDLFYVLVKGASSYKLEEKLGLGVLLPMSFGIGLFCGVLWIFVFGPCAKRRIETQKAAKIAEEDAAAEKESDVEAATSPAVENEENSLHRLDSFQRFLDGKAPVPAATPEKVSTKAVAQVPTETEFVRKVMAQAVSSPEPAVTAVSISWYKKFKNNTVDQDLQAQSMKESSRALKIWENEEQFDADAESLFNYIQVFTASLNSFAHGANDVANTIAPMSAVINIYMTGEVSSKTGVPKWMLAYGGLAIVIGLLLYGYRVMKTLGYKLTMLSASRGSSAELGSSLTVVTASFLGIPVSSTQCIVGAVTAVGLVGGRQAVDWWFLLKICCSWIGLFFTAVIFSAGLFSFCFYSPGAAYPAYQDEITTLGEQ